MKKTLLVLVVVALVSLPAFAADSLVSAGGFSLGGGANFLFNYGTYTYEPDVENSEALTDTTMGIGLYGKLGYFVIDSLAIGPILGINYESYTAEYVNEEGDIDTLDPVTTMSLDFGPWIGYYFDLGSAFYPYISAGFLLNYSSTDDSNDPAYTVSGMLYGPAIWAGALVSLVDGWALDFGLQFKYLFGTQTYEPDEGDSTDVAISTMDIGLFAGINVAF